MTSNGTGRSRTLAAPSVGDPLTRKSAHADGLVWPACAHKVTPCFVLLSLRSHPEVAPQELCLTLDRLFRENITLSQLGTQQV